VYVSANTGSGFHIWRQRFPEGQPVQVTAGATEEQGLAFAADGRSFVTSIGVDQNTIWVHDSRGERQVTSQGYAYQPKFSRDGKRLYYMLRSGASMQTWVRGALWVTDLESGARERLLSDFLMQDYSISPDDTRVVFSAVDDTGAGPIWVAALDGSAPPRRLVGAESARALFGPDGDVFFVQNEFLYRINPDGSGRQKLIGDRVSYLYGLSPDGKWAAVWTTGTAVALHSLDDSRPGVMPVRDNGSREPGNHSTCGGLVARREVSVSALRLDHTRDLRRTASTGPNPAAAAQKWNLGRARRWFAGREAYSPAAGIRGRRPVGVCLHAQHVAAQYLSRPGTLIARRSDAEVFFRDEWVERLAQRCLSRVR
jgi:hypothetical protein